MLRFLAAVVCVVVTACSESKPVAQPIADSAAALDTWAPADTATDTRPAMHDPDANCVKPGTMNNELAVGGYCNPDGGPLCPKPAGEIRLCSGSVKDVPLNTWFCTKPCTRDDECGSGALCLFNELGQGCVPYSCAPDAAVADALSRADSPSETATD